MSIVAEDGAALKQADPLVTRHYIKSLSDNELRHKPLLTEAFALSSSRILLVEDNVVNQMVATSMLKQLGFTAELAADGLEALKCLENASIDRPYALILMDCQMPNMDGYEATRQIRAGKAGKRYVAIPIIAITANAMSGDRQKCMETGMDDFISKPIDIDKINDKVQQWLSIGAGDKISTTQ